MAACEGSTTEETAERQSVSPLHLNMKQEKGASFFLTRFQGGLTLSCGKCSKTQGVRVMKGPYVPVRHLHRMTVD